MAEFPIRVTVDPTAATVGARKVRRELQLVNRAASGVRSALLGAFTVLAGGTALIGAVRTLAQFEQAMSTVAAVTQATTEQFEALGDEAQRLGGTTRFSATEAAEAMIFLARAGFDAGEVLATTADTLLLAQAGALDLGTAADIASNVLKGFRLSVLETGRVVDVLALAANSTNTNVQQLGDALKLVGPVAAGLGISLEETTAAVGALSDAGLQATLAGTGLRRVLGELQSPTDTTKELFRELGIEAASVQPATVGLVTALENMENAALKAGGGLEVFGQRGGPAFEVLANSLPEIRASIEALREADGTAERIAKTMDDNLNGALLQVKASFEAFTLALGEAGASSQLRDFLEGLTDGLRFLVDNIDDVVIGIEALAVAIGVLLVGKLVAAAFAVQSFSALLIANPVFLFAAAVGVATFALIKLATATGEAAAGAGLLNREFTNTKVLFGDIEKIDKTIVRARELKDQELLIDGLTSKLKILRDTALELGDDRDTSALALQRLAPDIEIDPNVEFTRSGLVPGGEVERVIGEQIAVLEKQLAGARERLATERVDTAATEAARAALDNYLDTLGQQATLARASAEEQDVLNAQFEATRLAYDQGITSGSELAQILARVRGEIERTQQAAALRGIEDFIQNLEEQNEALRTEADAIQDGELARKQALAVLEAERIARQAGLQLTFDEEDRIRELVASEFELAEAIKAVEEEREKTDKNIPSRLQAFSDVIAALDEEARLLGVSREERFAANEITRVEAELRSVLRDETFNLTEAQKEELRVKLLSNEAGRERTAILQEAIGPTEQLAEQQRILAEEIAKTEDPTGRLAAAFRDSKIAALELETDGLSGLERGLLKFQKTAEDSAAQFENLLSSAFRGAEDAFVEFVKTGEVSFERLVDTILEGLARIIFQQLLLKALDSTGFGGLLGSVAGRQAGGPVEGNRPFIVGEEGPELFVPQGSGTIIPSDETMSATSAQQPAAPVVTVEPPQVNVQVVNVQDRDEVPSAIESPEGTEAVLNVLRKNRNALREFTL